MKLRDYQQQVVDKIMWAKDLPGNDVVVVAQGGGKSIIIADVADKLGKALIICPNKEILEQNIEKMEHYVDRDLIGVYSASMGEKSIKKITYGTIQSMYKHPELFIDFDIVIYDEADLHNPKRVEGMSSQLFKGAKIKKVFGFTGTPYRQDVFYKYPPGYRGLAWQKTKIEAITTTMMINRYKSRFWKRMLCVINTHELMDQGYLTPIEYHEMNLVDHDEIPTNKSKSDFDMEAFEEILQGAHEDIVEQIQSLPHKAKLVFCSSIEQAEALHELTPDSEVVTSKTSKKKRAATVKALKDGSLKILYNVGIFTVGFDYPELDCLVLLRPTRSLRLHSQILGRVSRIAEGKTKGHVYDFVSNVKNMGKLEEIVVKKVRAYYQGKEYMTWDVVSDAMPNGFHHTPLYKYEIRKKPKNESLSLTF